jgi:hypothetical protein
MRGSAEFPTTQAQEKQGGNFCRLFLQGVDIYRFKVGSALRFWSLLAGRNSHAWHVDCFNLTEGRPGPDPCGDRPSSSSYGGKKYEDKATGSVDSTLLYFP